MFTKEVWSLAPGHLLLWAMLSVWEPVDMAVGLWVSTTVLDTVSRSKINSVNLDTDGQSIVDSKYHIEGRGQYERRSIRVPGKNVIFSLSVLEKSTRVSHKFHSLIPIFPTCELGASF